MPFRDQDRKREYDREYRLGHRAERVAYEKVRAARPERREQRSRANIKYRRNLTDEQRGRYNAQAKEWRKANPLSPEKRVARNAARRESALRQKYGKSSAELAAMLEAQGGVCKICRADKPGSRYGWHTDHCHETGVVRGILCRSCNMHLGAFKHDPALLRRAAEYIEEFRQPAEVD